MSPPRKRNASPQLKDRQQILSKNIPVQRSTGRFSPPPSSLGNRPVSRTSLSKDGKPQTNEERLTSILQRTLELDESEHEKRAVLLSSVTLFISENDPQLTKSQKELFMEVLYSILSTPPPFSVITKSYRQIHFHNKDHPSDVTVSYKMLKMLLKLDPPISPAFLGALMRRMTSASKDDRIGARECLKMIDIQHAPFLIHLLALTLVPPPPHGTNGLLEFTVHLLKTYQAPPPLFDDFFVTTSFDDSADVLSITGAISECRLKDGITIFEELECTFRMLHYAPHYQSFSSQLIEAMKALHEHSEEYAHQNRRFLLNHWPRNDPQKAVLFMKEATAICVHGPIPEEYVWQRLSWRSVSIHWQIAMEGLTFIQQTIHRAEGFDHSELIYLLNDAIEHHWNHHVKRKATEVKNLLPENITPVGPKPLPKETWSTLAETAQNNYPDTCFKKLGPTGMRRKAAKKN